MKDIKEIGDERKWEREEMCRDIQLIGMFFPGHSAFLVSLCVLLCWRRAETRVGFISVLSQIYMGCEEVKEIKEMGITEMHNDSYA